MESDPINMIVANNIEALMQRKDIDAASLARASGLNPTGIYDILKGKSRSPKVETIGKIAKALNVPISVMFSTNVLDDLDDDLMIVFNQLSAEKRGMLLQAARVWVSDSE